jgi:hypothetical protein
MYCTGGIRCERGSAYLKAKVSRCPAGTAGMVVKKGPPTACVELSTPYPHHLLYPQPAGFLCLHLVLSSIEIVRAKLEVLKSQNVKST